MYKVGDRIVHPMHGAGVIQEIVEKKFGDKTEQYYALKLLLDEVVLYLPTSNLAEIGIRPVCSEATAQKVLRELPDVDQDEEQIWNRRYRENMLRIRTGDIYEVAKVVKNLELRRENHGLSNGEKKMLGAAEHIFISEIALALQKPPQEIKNIITAQLCRS